MRGRAGWSDGVLLVGGKRGRGTEREGVREKGGRVGGGRV